MGLALRVPPLLKSRGRSRGFFRLEEGFFNPFLRSKKAARQVPAGLLHPFGALGRPGSPPLLHKQCTQQHRRSAG